MPEFVARVFVAILGEALITAMVAAIDRMYQALPLPVQRLSGLLGYALLFSTYVVAFLFCAVALLQAETFWLRAMAGLLGAYCSYEATMLVRKVLS